MELIIFIAIIAYIVKAAKKSNEAQAKTAKRQQPTYQMPKQATRVNSARVQVQQQREQFKQMTLENIEKARQHATQKLQEFEKDVMNELHGNVTQEEQVSQPKRSAMQQVHEGRMKANTTTIVERAKTSTAAKKADVTLETMEAEHNHSERVAPAVHHHPEDVISDNMLGTVEDLMVKGYDGNLCFERDFVGEGLDMISRFSYQ